MRYKFPTNYGENCILLPVDTALIPLIAGALRYFETRVAWATDADYEAGYNAIAELKACMASSNCVQALIEAQNKQIEATDRLYRLLDRSLNGTNYFVRLNPDGSETVDPPISIIPPASTDQPNAMRAHLGRVWQLLENSTRGDTFAAGAGIAGSGALDDERSVRDTLRDAQGMINAGWFGWGGRRATLADLIASLKIGSDADQGILNNTFEEILNAGGNTTGIFNAVRGLFDTASNTALEGGQLGVLLASSIANAAIAGATAAQLDAINTRLLDIDDKLIDRDQGLHITDWVKSVRATALEIRNSIRVGADETTIQQLLQSILAALGTGSGGGPVNVVLDPAQLAALTGLLECICEATNGPPPPPPAAPQFDPSVCGAEWQLVATWRPTMSGTTLTGADGTWTTENIGLSVSQTIGPNGESLLVFPLFGEPFDCRVWFAYADGYIGTGTGNLDPWRTDGQAGGPGRPSIFLNAPRICQQFAAYASGAQNQLIGYAAQFGVDTEDQTLTPDNFAIFVTFQAFG